MRGKEAFRIRFIGHGKILKIPGNGVLLVSVTWLTSLTFASATVLRFSVLIWASCWAGASKNYAKDLSDLVEHLSDEKKKVPEIPTSTISLRAEAGEKNVHFWIWFCYEIAPVFFFQKDFSRKRE